MSSIYKRADSPKYWWSAFHRGRRLRKSTGMPQQGLAKKVQMHWDLCLVTGDYSFLGKSNQPSMDVITFSRHYLRLRERKSAKTYRTSKSMINRFISNVTALGINRIDEITTKVLDDYIDVLKVAPKTIKNHIGEINLFLSQAVKEEVIKSNPAKHVTLPLITKKDLHRNLETEDLEVIFNNAGEWLLYFSFLYHTGLRAGDVALLTYGNIEFKNKAIVSFVRKSRRIHKFPLADVLQTRLSKSENPLMPIFPALYADTEMRLNDKLKKPRKYMQMVLELNGREKATLHSFRVTYNNMLRDLGLEIEDRKILLAHSSSETTKIYTHPNFELASKFVNQIRPFQAINKT